MRIYRRIGTLRVTFPPNVEYFGSKVKVILELSKKKIKINKRLCGFNIEQKKNKSCQHNENVEKILLAKFIRLLYTRTHFFFFFLPFLFSDAFFLFFLSLFLFLIRFGLENVLCSLVKIAVLNETDRYRSPSVY